MKIEIVDGLESGESPLHIEYHMMIREIGRVGKVFRILDDTWKLYCNYYAPYKLAWIGKIDNWKMHWRRD